MATVPRPSGPWWCYAARLITQTAEQLNQLTRLSETFPPRAFRAEEAKYRILRPPLREGFGDGVAGVRELSSSFFEEYAC